MLASPPQEEVDRLLKLPEDDPAVIAFEDTVMADRVVFGLGRIIADDFGELQARVDAFTPIWKASGS
jgi:hypothetical protein